MEEPYDTPDPEFVKGFNEGYTLARHLAKLGKQLGEADMTGARGSGFQAGRQQAQVEAEKARSLESPQRLPDYLSYQPDNPTPNKDQGPKRDRELER